MLCNPEKYLRHFQGHILRPARLHRARRNGWTKRYTKLNSVTTNHTCLHKPYWSFPGGLNGYSPDRVYCSRGNNLDEYLNIYVNGVWDGQCWAIATSCSRSSYDMHIYIQPFPLHLCMGCKMASMTCFICKLVGCRRMTQTVALQRESEYTRAGNVAVTS